MHPTLFRFCLDLPCTPLFLSSLGSLPLLFLSQGIIHVSARRLQESRRRAVEVRCECEYVMDASSPSPSTPEMVVTPQQQPSSENPTSKRRRMMVHKTVVTVRVEEISSGKQKGGDGPPADQWSWRKYGQKPIKGSPYPRGYYRCSTSKGCSAKKQVERCRTDASVLVITYTSSHNHPDTSPPSPSSVQAQHTEQEGLTSPIRSTTTTTIAGDCAEAQTAQSQKSEGSSSHRSPPPKCPEDSSGIRPESRTEEARDPPTTMTIPFDEEERGLLPSCPPTTRPSSDEENDFFDELEELPMSSSFTSLMRSSSSFDNIIPIS